MVFPLTSLRFRKPFSVDLKPTPFAIKIYFLGIPWRSDLIVIPDLSLPPVILTFPFNPKTVASISSPICNPIKELASLSFSSLVIDFPFLSDSVNLKLTKYSKKSCRLLINLWRLVNKKS